MAVEHRQAILDTERVPKDDDKPTAHPLKGDDVDLDYYEDGYPKLPEFLDRRPKPALAEAA